jgi:predicted membrane protein
MSYQAPDPYQPGVQNQPPPRVIHDNDPKPPRVTNDPIYEERIKPAKTSAAAAFALVFGVSALLSVLTVIIGPLGIVLALVGIILGVVGMRNAKRVGVTGKGVALGGLILSVIALLLGVALAAGVTFYLNDEQAVDRLEQQVQNLRDQLPNDVNIPQP